MAYKRICAIANVAQNKHQKNNEERHRKRKKEISEKKKIKKKNIMINDEK